MAELEVPGNVGGLGEVSEEFPQVVLTEREHPQEVQVLLL